MVELAVGQCSDGAACKTVTFEQQQVPSVGLELELALADAVVLPRFALILRAHVFVAATNTLGDMGLDHGDPLLAFTESIGVEREVSVLAEDTEIEVIWVIRVTRNITSKDIKVNDSPRRLHQHFGF